MDRFKSFGEWLAVRLDEAPVPKPPPVPSVDQKVKQKQTALATADALKNQVAATGGMVPPEDLLDDPREKANVAADAVKDMARKGQTPDIKTTVDVVSGKNQMRKG